MDLGALRDELIAKVLAAASARGKPLRPPIDGRRGSHGARPRASRPTEAPVGRRGGRRGVAIGASTGGVMALQTLLRGLPAPLGVPVFVAQHMPAHFTGPLAELLEDSTGVPAREARDGEPAEPGWVYVAPGGRHLTVVAPRPGGEGARLCVSDDPAAVTLRPSVNRLFESVARVYGAGTVAVVLTGMGNDGTEGLAAVKAAGGLGLCQDELTSAVYGMPGSAVKAGLADVVAPVGRLGEEIGRALAAVLR
jgi:two-component system chemotaxis response regulator CheB